MHDACAMPIVRISRLDTPGAYVDDGTLAALMPRLSQLPRRGDDGSLLIAFTDDTSPGDAVQAIEHALDSIPMLADWRSRFTVYAA